MNWIWIKETNKNTFAEFEQPFIYTNGRIVLRISADYKYVAYINGQMVSNGQCADLPDYKIVNEVDVVPFVKKGKNILHVIAWHMGEDRSVCRTMMPSVAFEIIENGKTIAQSCRETRARESKNYLKGEVITAQLGYGFNYDCAATLNEWQNAIEVQTEFIETERIIKQISVDACCISKVVAQGVFAYREEYKAENIAQQVQRAWLSSLRFDDMTGKNRLGGDTLLEPITFQANGGNGIFAVMDVGRETCGYLAFTITVEKPCKMVVGWGEHLADLRVRTAMGGRNFTIEFSLKEGENVFDDYLLRLGCRYLCIFVESEKVTVSRFGIREVGYPFQFPKKDFGDKLYNAIYETGRRTLYLSAHEHYEDCPWREQALYGMDSRNQMLFGYGAFEEYDYPRANLMLIAKAMREDGLIALTAPAEMPITIPAFTAYWLIAIGENAEVDYNADFIKEILPYAEKGLNTLLAQEGKNGLKLFTKTPYWNFHEWSDGLDGQPIFRDYEIEAEDDGALTALVAMATDKIVYLEEKIGNIRQARNLKEKAKKLKRALESYYDEERGIYASRIRQGEKHGYHAYMQALCLLTGGVPKERQKKLCEVLKYPIDYDVIPATFAALQLKYDALIKYGNEADYCVEEVARIFEKMLLKGATSYWETEHGEADFDDGGSLCHGWSAVCCWVLDKCATKDTNEG